jgi:hypothetical protein
MNSTEPTTRFALTPRIAMGFAALFAFGAPGYAQTPEDQEPAARNPAAERGTQSSPQDAVADESAAAAPLPEEKINQFADAYVAVEGIQTQAAQQISSAADQEAANAVKVNAETEMIKAVERSGLKVEEFNEIVQAMTADAELRTKVVSKIEQRRRG